MDVTAKLTDKVKVFEQLSQQYLFTKDRTIEDKVVKAGIDIVQTFESCKGDLPLSIQKKAVNIQSGNLSSVLSFYYNTIDKNNTVLKYVPLTVAHQINSTVMHKYSTQRTKSVNSTIHIDNQHFNVGRTVQNSFLKNKDSVVSTNKVTLRATSYNNINKITSRDNTNVKGKFKSKKKRMQETTNENVGSTNQRIFDSLVNHDNANFLKEVTPIYEQYIIASTIAATLQQSGKYIDIKHVIGLNGEQINIDELKAKITKLHAKYYGKKTTENMKFSDITNHIDNIAKNSTAIENRINTVRQKAKEFANGILLGTVSPSVVNRSHIASSIDIKGQKTHNIINNSLLKRNSIGRSLIRSSANLFTSQKTNSAQMDVIDDEDRTDAIEQKNKELARGLQQKGTELKRNSIRTTINFARRAKNFTNNSRRSIQTAYRTTRGAKAIFRATAQVSKVVTRIVVEAGKQVAIGVGRAVGSLLVAVGWEVLLAIIVVVIVAVVLLPLMYSLFTHPAPDIAINETYAYVTKQDADAVARLKALTYKTKNYIPSKDDERTVSCDGHTYTVKLRQPGLSYIIAIPSFSDDLKSGKAFGNSDPMSYVSLISALYGEKGWSFPTFSTNIKVQNGTDNQGHPVFKTIPIAVDARKVPSSYDPRVNNRYDDILSHLYAFDIQTIKPSSKSKSVNTRDAIIVIRGREHEYSLLSFLFEGWWAPTRKLWVSMNKDLDAMSFYKSIGGNGLNEKELEEYSKIKSDWTKIQPDLDKYGIKPNGNSTQWFNNYKSIVENEKSSVDKSIDTIVNDVNNTMSIVNKGISSLASARMIDSCTVSQYVPPNSNKCICEVNCPNNTNGDQQLANCETKCNAEYNQCMQGCYERGGNNCGARCGNRKDLCCSDCLYQYYLRDESGSFQAYLDQLNNILNNAEKYKSEINDLFDKLETMNPVNNSPLGVSSWYNTGELQRESGICQTLEQKYNLFITAINDASSIALDVESSIGEEISKLESKSMSVEQCISYCNTYDKSDVSKCASYDAKLLKAISNLEAINKSISNTVKQMKCTEYEFLQAHMVENVSIALENFTVNSNVQFLSDSDFKDFLPIERDAYVHYFNKSLIARYILFHILSLNNVKAHPELKNARSMYVQIYNEYGMIFKSLLLVHSTWKQDSISVNHRMGYYYDPILAWKGSASNMNTFVQPSKVPNDFLSSGNDTTDVTNGFLGSNTLIRYFFTVDRYGVVTIGGQSEKSGFLANKSNWYQGNIGLTGDVVSSSIEGESIPVVAPFSGTMCSISAFKSLYPKESVLFNILPPNGYVIMNKIVALSDMFQELRNNGKKPVRYLSDIVVLQGIKLDSNILSKMLASKDKTIKVNGGDLLGTAKRLYIMYEHQPDMNYSIAGGIVLIPRDVHTLFVPHIYFDWNPDMVKPGGK